MSGSHKICAVVPVKDTRQAKQRLAGILAGARRQELALAMLEDVLATLARVRELAGIVVVTADPAAAATAISHGARVARDGAGDGHSGAVAAAARQLTTEGFDMLTLPGDIPLVEGEDIRELIAVHHVGATARRPRLHHRARARRARLQRRAVLAGRGRAAALRQ